MFILLALMICGFIGGYYQLSILAIFLIITGWCGVRSNQVYNIEQILCVTFFSGYILVYTAVDLILKVIAYEQDVPIPALVSLFGGVVFYSAACIIGKMLYDELRGNYQQVAPELIQPSIMSRLPGMGTQNQQRQQVGQHPQEDEERPCMFNIIYIHSQFITKHYTHNKYIKVVNIPPRRNDDRGRALGGGNRINGDPKFKAFSGQAHSMNDQ